MDNVDTVSRFSHALNTLRTSSLQLNGEPHFHHLADPPGKALLQAYHQNLTPRKIVFYAEIPSADQHPTGEAWIVTLSSPKRR